ncbi:MAG: transposase [Saprospiraceae bacterium]|nr:transposase [Saprospiraceae bacterium]
MRRAYHIHDQNELYFMTLQVIDWVDIFTRQIYRDIIIDSLAYCRKNKGLRLWAYVVMSNHLHIIISSTRSDLSGVLRDFKRHTSSNILQTMCGRIESRFYWMKERFETASLRHSRNKGLQFWTHENRAIHLWSRKWIFQKLNYIHMNPVKAGLVARPEDWLYSSARNYSGLDNVMQIDLIGIDD